MYGEKLVTWRSKKQSVSKGNAEVEFRALVVGICESIWLKRVVYELRIQITCSMKVFIAKNPVHHDRTKHIAIDRHFAKDRIDLAIVYALYCIVILYRVVLHCLIIQYDEFIQSTKCDPKEPKYTQ